MPALFVCRKTGLWQNTFVPPGFCFALKAAAFQTSEKRTFRQEKSARMPALLVFAVQKAGGVLPQRHCHSRKPTGKRLLKPRAVRDCFSRFAAGRTACTGQRPVRLQAAGRLRRLSGFPRAGGGRLRVGTGGKCSSCARSWHGR